MLYDGRGNLIEVGESSGGSVDTFLKGADILGFGDSNMYYSYGNSIADTGSLYEVLWRKYRIKSMVLNAQPGINIWQTWGKLNAFATDENVAKYNKRNTIFLFHAGTNDELSNIQAAYNGNYATGYGSATSSNGIGFIAQLLDAKFPKA